MELPKTVQIFLTRMCTRTCDYCAVRETPLKGDALSPVQWIRVVDGLRRAGFEAFKFGGGEPFMFGDQLLDIVRATEKRPSVILTNGDFGEDSLLDLAEMVSDGFDLRVHLSVNAPLGYGCDEKTLRGWNRIALLRAFNIPSGGNVIVSRSSIKHLHRIAFDLASLDARVNLCPMIAGPPPLAPDGRPWRYRMERSDERLEPEDSDELAVELARVLETANRIGAEFTTSLDYIRNMPQFGHSYLPCRTLQTPHLLVVDADGYLLACPDVAGERCNDLHVDEVITNPSKLAEYAHQWRKDVDDCSGCYLSSVFGNPLDQAIRRTSHGDQKKDQG